MNLLFSLLVAALCSGSSAPAAVIAPSVQDSKLEVSVPMNTNPSCPIMGKPISTRLYTDTSYGRIYICCKSCIRDIHADLEIAYRTAFPVTKEIANEVCPVSGEAIDEHSPRVLLQGFEFSVHTEAQAEIARTLAQVTLARLHRPELADLGNQTCPVSGEAVDVNTVVVIGDTLVRLSAPTSRDQVERSPAKILERAREIRAQELAAEAEKRAKDGAASEKPGNGKDG